MPKKTIIWFTLTLVWSICSFGQVQQVIIPRVEKMPNEPSPFNVRDWREVAMKYDSFIYDIQKTGTHLPFLTLKQSGLNYPQNPAFGLHTFVGTANPQGNEAINVLPSLVGASLTGIDKSNQFGKNWVLMSQDFFNLKNGQNIYLNNPSSGSGNDWWYDMMPNIYFYQLYDLYPNIGGDANNQFTTVANRFLEAVAAMGGSDIPWQKAFMNYRAWNFKEMKPNPGGVKEPEAAGAYAWVLYHAYKKTGNPEFLKGAEWAIEFLNEWESNPSYELQLPYGTYIAARMNAELGTNYNIEKMVNWSFDRGFLRGWGTIAGRWGSFDVHGLIGEANENGNDYAFQMNGHQQAAALVPLVRYDKRFARAIGKWILNLANANRLFYPGFLPSFMQDASSWSNAYDPDRVIGYEALREKWEGYSPFSTGDAAKSGWAATNLALYGTSPIGYLGSLIEKTNIDKILKLDLLKTDFFKDKAYPTFLLFNPYSEPRSVDIPIGTAQSDIYEALSESFVLKGVSGTVKVNIPANQAVIITIVPAAGTVTYRYNRMLINGVVVDYSQSKQPFNYAPRIQAVATAVKEIEIGDSTLVYGKAFDQDSPTLIYTWSTSKGTITGPGRTVKWIAPKEAGTYQINLAVEDESGNRDSATTSIRVVPEINHAPVIHLIHKNPSFTAPGGKVELFCDASDRNGDVLIYDWSSSGGTFSGNGSRITWNAPGTEGAYQIFVDVTDPKGLKASSSTTILVKTFNAGSGKLIAWYPFSGSANDVSGNQHHGQINGAQLTTDAFGKPASALFFNGNTSSITVANTNLLNTVAGITVSCWFSPNLLADKETFLLSHGSWQNRWKISLIPSRQIRWTVNTQKSIGDLDSEIKVQKDSFYHLTVTYDGTALVMYLNGQLHSYKPLAGDIKTTELPFLMGQMLPGNTEYNFRGTLDEVRIYDYAFVPEQVLKLYNESITPIKENIETSSTLKVFPNPVSETLFLSCSAEEFTGATCKVSSINGKVIMQRDLISGVQERINTSQWEPGVYIVTIKSGQVTLTVRLVKI